MQTQEVVGLKEYFERLISDAKESHGTALAIARDEIARRLDLLNGEASRLTKMQETYYPREVAEQKMDQLDKSIRELQLFKAVVDGKASQNSVSLALGFAVFGLLISLCSSMMGVASLLIRLFVE